MALPKQVKIGGALWRIEGDAESIDRLKEESNYGISHESKQIIRVDMTTAPAKASESLLHEVIHSIQSVYLTPSGRTEEAFVKTFTAGLFQVLRDNPDVVAFILGKEE